MEYNIFFLLAYIYFLYFTYFSFVTLINPSKFTTDISNIIHWAKIHE